MLSPLEIKRELLLFAKPRNSSTLHIILRFVVYRAL